MPAVDRIELDKTDLTLEIGDAIRLYPTLYPSGATGKIVWSSSDDYVAVVNSSGGGKEWRNSLYLGKYDG